MDEYHLANGSMIMISLELILVMDKTILSSVFQNVFWSLSIKFNIYILFWTLITSKKGKIIQKNIPLHFEMLLFLQYFKKQNLTHMNRNETWLFYLFIPFIIGSIIHLALPIEFILTTNPKVEKTYHHFATQMETSIIRTLSLQNAQKVQNLLQIYENLRRVYGKLYENSLLFEQMHFKQTFLNSAYELAQMSSSEYLQEEISKSMWFIPGVASVNEMNPEQRQIFARWTIAQPYLVSTLKNSSKFYQGFSALKTIFNQNQSFYIQFPSSQKTKFTNLDYQILTEEYHLTLQNYHKNGMEETLFVKNQKMEICQPFLFKNSILGVTCLAFNIYELLNQVGPILYNPKFQLSNNQYFLVKLKYNISQEDENKIIMQFQNMNFLNFTQNQIPKFQNYESLSFSGKNNFGVYVFYDGKKDKQFVVPISLINSKDHQQIFMHLITSNHAIRSTNKIERQHNGMLVNILAPLVTLLIISSIVILCVLRCLLKDFAKTIQVLNKHCQLILQGDLHLTITDSNNQSDLVELLKQFQILNQLHKYSDPNFFSVSKPERLIKYLQCHKLFEQLGYDLSNVCECISDCYEGISQLQNSVRYLQISVKSNIKALQKKQRDIDILFEKKMKNEKVNSGSKKLEKSLRRRLNKLVHRIYFSSLKGNNSSISILHQVQQKVDILQKIVYPKILNLEYLSSLMIELKLMYQQGHKQEAKQSIQRLGNLLNAYDYEFKYLNNDPTQVKPSPDVLEGYWWHTKAEILQNDGKIIEAYWHFVQSLEFNLFHPHIHGISHKSLKQLLTYYDIDERKLQKMQYNRNYRKRKERQYIFLIDVCQPDIDEEALRSWRRRTKQLVQHIFNQFIRDDDRIAVFQFCSDLKICVNLTLKSNQPKLLKKELMASVRSRKQKSLSNPEFCLFKAVERVKHLHEQKWFIMLIKPQVQVDGLQILQIIQELPNSELIIVMQNQECLLERGEKYFMLDLIHGKKDVERILEEKNYRSAEKYTSVF